MTTLTEAAHAGEFIASKGNGTRSVEQGTLKSGNSLVAGTVVGLIPTGTSSAAAKGGNTGNGVFTLDVTTPILPGASEGVYKVVCTAAATNSGTFRVTDPNGDVLGDVAVGSTFADQIKFAIADGATDFVVGDEFDVTISALTGKYTALAPAGTDGSQIAAGMIYATIDATSADTRATFFVRDGEVNGNLLTWPNGITTAQKAIAKDQLKHRGILVR